jgi:hypothetical protein
MADRIFPTNVNEDPIDSEMVFQGIDWDNFNSRLAEVKEAKKGKGKLNDGLQAYLDKKNASEKCAKCDCQPCECENDDDKKDVKDGKKDVKDGKGASVQDIIDALPEAEKKKLKLSSSIVFNHPSQLSAEAVEAAIASGDEGLKNAILAARHERRVRLASKVEEMINVENEKNEKLAQRRAYREALVERVASAEKAIKTAKSKKSEKVASEEPVFVKVSELSNDAKKVFAQRAIAQGFPIEYVEAMIGTQETPDNTVEIREVMSSELNKTVKMAAVKSMVREATLTDADYSRLIDYWVNELGYGDKEWVESLFTKKYDKKS